MAEQPQPQQEAPRSTQPPSSLAELVAALPPDGSDLYLKASICEELKQRCTSFTLSHSPSFLPSFLSFFPLMDDLHITILSHDVCFFKWYNEEFLEGKAQVDGCTAEWQAYRECTKVRSHTLSLFRSFTAMGLANTGPSEEIEEVELVAFIER
jgi:hypothetical protein